MTRYGKTRNGAGAQPDPGRRDFLKTSLMAATVAASGSWALPGRGENGPGNGPRVAVVGSGVFGGWTALHLLRQGARVTLIDAWGPGNARASSGGESRVIRGIYGPDEIYVDWVVRSFDLWRKAQRDWGASIYTPTGALWMFRGEDDYARTALPILARHGLPVEEMSPEAAASRFPSVDFSGVRTVFHEEQAGFLAARDACRRLVEAFTAGGGTYRHARAAPVGTGKDGITGLSLSDGTRLEADRYVFACGPWLGRIFPELLGNVLTPTRQDVYYFGTPAGSNDYDPGNFPVWVDLGERIYYGIPGNDGHGFKIADDTRGESIDPTSLNRTPDPAGIRRARAFLGTRFPELAGAPLVQARVCQYTNTPDGHFILDRHPEASNVWLAGGGSGHGFKLGPAVGEHVAGLVLGSAEPLEKFSVSRLEKARVRDSQISGQ